MSVFDLDMDGQAALAEEARSHPIMPDQIEPSFFEGTGRAIGTGVMRGGARAAQFLGMAATAPVVLWDKFLGQEGDHTDAMFRTIDDYVHSAVDFWTPAAAEIGTAGRVLGGLSEAVLPLMAGGGNPTLLIGSQEMGTATSLVRQGASAPAAVGAGIAQGAAAAVGFKVPFLGKTLATRMASGAAGNLAVNTAGSIASAAVLKAAGDEAQAEQFNAADLEARAIDVLTGLAFGGIAHASLRPSERAAILTATNAKHFQEDTAPGAPANGEAFVAHQEAMASAIHDLLRGEPVVAPDKVVQADFVSDRVAPDTSPGETLTDKAIEARFRDQLDQSQDRAIAEYAKLPESEGGRVLNTDLARELSADYRADRTRSSAVHEPASELVKKMYAQKLAEAPAPGQKPVVVFTAGGTGAGKSTAIAALSESSAALRSAQIIYDTNLNTLKSSVEKIEQALAAGKSVRVMYVARDPIQALVKGALPRAMRMGRTVPLIEHARTHAGSAKVVRELAQYYKEDPRVDIQVIDNSGGKGHVKLGSIDRVAAPEYDGLVGELHAALEAERQAGTISEAVYRGTLADARSGVQDGGGVSSGGPRTRSGNGGQPQSPSEVRPVGSPEIPEGLRDLATVPDLPPTKSAIPSFDRIDHLVFGLLAQDRKQSGSIEQPEPVDVTVSAARQRLAASDLEIPTGDVAADGTPVHISARELMAQADEQAASTKNDAKAFEAAVACHLQSGGA